VIHQAAGDGKLPAQATCRQTGFHIGITIKKEGRIFNVRQLK